MKIREKIVISALCVGLLVTALLSYTFYREAVVARAELAAEKKYNTSRLKWLTRLAERTVIAVEKTTCK